jgi:GNAT superfamily N-acetyltransferase
MSISLKSDKKLNSNIKVFPFTGEKIRDLIPKIAELRIEVFAEYPFLYIGDIEYEIRYLSKFLTMKDAIVVTAYDDDTVVGISTGYPFSYESDAMKKLFLSAGRNPADYFCFGESVLQKSYRGLGIGKRFFEERESHVSKVGHYKYICFYTAIRAIDDPRRPADYRPLAPFWKSRGFVEHPELVGTVSYQEIGESEESPKSMVFWIKKL